MSGKYIMINNQNVVVDSFEATDHGANILFTINRTVDGGASTGAIITLFGNPSALSVVDSDSNVTFTLNDGQISEYRYFTRDNQAALEYFKLEGSQISAQ